jgi:outer membrane protein
VLGLPAGPAAGRDISLSEAVALSLHESSAVRSARHDSLAAHMSYAAARALRFPDINLSATSTFKNEIPTLDISVPPIHLSREIGSKDVYQANLEISQPLFTGGLLSNSIGAAREQSLAGAEALRAEEMATVFECRQTYLNAVATASGLAGARASLGRLEIARSDVENLFKAGLADSIDILEAELALEKGRSSVAEQEVAHSVALVRLRSLIGVDSREDLVLTEQIEAPPQPVTAMSAPETRRPEVRRLEHLERAADFAYRTARAGYYPSLAGFATYSVGRPNQDLFDNKWNDYVMAGLRLSWDFNLADRTGRSARAAAERARSARAARSDLIDQLERARAAALEQTGYALGNVKRLARQVDLASRQYALAGARQREGTLPLNRLLEMEAELTVLDRQYRAALAGYYLAETEYLYAIGSPRLFGGLR